MLLISRESVIKFTTNFEGRLNVVASECILNQKT